MDELARSRPYFQHYTQNIDCIKHLLPDLEAKTVRLHGQVDQARCRKCNWVCEFEPHLFQGDEAVKDAWNFGKAYITLVAPAKFYLLSRVPLLSKTNT
jgi:NAD-dependent SIR2 family protein deacetylase